MVCHKKTNCHVKMYDDPRGVAGDPVDHGKCVMPGHTGRRCRPFASSRAQRRSRPRACARSKLAHSISATKLASVCAWSGLKLAHSSSTRRSGVLVDKRQCTQAYGAPLWHPAEGDEDRYRRYLHPSVMHRWIMV